MQLEHNIAVINVGASKSVVDLGDSVSINVTVQNKGSYTESFSVDVFLSIYANTTFLSSKIVSELAPQANKILEFTWNTKGFLTGPYKITAIASRVPFEINIDDNTLTFGVVKVQTEKMHTLALYNYPGCSMLLPFTINNTENVAFWSGALDEATYVITVPSTITDGHTVYGFKKWEDDTTNPIRTIILTSDMNIFAQYEPLSQPLPVVHIDPIVVTAQPYSNFTVKLAVTNVTNLNRWEAKIYYDTRFMDYVSATEGTFLKTAGATTFTVEFNEAYNTTHGCVQLACSLSESSLGMSGSGILAAITFHACASANSISILKETKLVNSTGITIPHTTLEGVGLLRIKLIADINNDGVVDVFDAVLLAGSAGSVKGEPPGQSSIFGYNPYADLNNPIDGIIDIFDAVILSSHAGEVDP